MGRGMGSSTLVRRIASPPESAGTGMGSRRGPSGDRSTPPLPVPEDNSLTPEKVELGKRLFFDPRLSEDGSLACASCHLPDQGWTTQTPLSPSYPTTMERRNSQTLVNVAYNSGSGGPTALDTSGCPLELRLREGSERESYPVPWS
jgi:cytochrome c peroxidase